MSSPSRVHIAALWLIALSACSKSGEHTGGPLPVATAPSEQDLHGKSIPDPQAPAPKGPGTPLTAEEIFATRCAACHGTDGKGDGPASAPLNPKPRNYTDAAWQKSVTDDHIRKTIIEGGPAVGKSPLMVPNADLADRPEVVDGLVKIIRGFAAK